jgi:hypothetical protein
MKGDYMNGNWLPVLAVLGASVWLYWFSMTLQYILQAANKSHAALDELQAIKGELARIRRATLHQGPYEP